MRFNCQLRHAAAQKVTENWGAATTQGLRDRILETGPARGPWCPRFGCPAQRGRTWTSDPWLPTAADHSGGQGGRSPARSGAPQWPLSPAKGGGTFVRIKHEFGADNSESDAPLLALKELNCDSPREYRLGDQPVRNDSLKKLIAPRRGAAGRFSDNQHDEFGQLRCPSCNGLSSHSSN